MLVRHGSGVGLRRRANRSRGRPRTAGTPAASVRRRRRPRDASPTRCSATGRRDRAGAAGGARRGRGAEASEASSRPQRAHDRRTRPGGSGCSPWCPTSRRDDGSGRRGGRGRVRGQARQIVKDLNVLWFCGLPGARHGRPDRGRHGRASRARASSGSPTPTTCAGRCAWTSSEASALIVALRALREAARPDVRPIVDRTLAKLEVAAGEAPRPPPRSRCAPPPRTWRPPAARAASPRRSWPGGRCASTTTSRARRVHGPGGRPDAPGDRRRATTTSRPGATGRGPAAVPAGPDLARRTSWTPPSTTTPTSRRATSARASSSRPRTTCSSTCCWRRTRGGWPSTTRPSPARRPGGRLRMRLRAGDPAWLVRLLLQLGSEVTGWRSPPEISRAVHRAATAALANYA